VVSTAAVSTTAGATPSTGDAGASAPLTASPMTRSAGVSLIGGYRHRAGRGGLRGDSIRHSLDSLGRMKSAAAALERLSELSATPEVAALAAAFAKAGAELALVGGPVRDAFLGAPIHDLDFATDAQPDRILELVTPISEAQWDIGRAFGTIGASIGGHTVEITTYRSDTYDHASRKPAVQFGSSLDGDLTRRDFT